MSFGALPIELLENVGAHVERSDDLVSLILTCRMSHRLLTRVLYRDVDLSTTSRALEFCTTLANDDTFFYATEVKSLTIREMWLDAFYPDWPDPWDVIFRAFSRLSRLEYFASFDKCMSFALVHILVSAAATLETLHCTLGGFLDEHAQADWSQIQLPRLRNLKLVLQNHKWSHFVRHVMVTYSAQIRRLSLECDPDGSFRRKEVLEYMSAESWASLRHLEIDAYDFLTKPWISRLRRLQSLTISYVPDHEFQQEITEIETAGESMAMDQHLPALKTLTCALYLLPLFFPPLQRPMSVICDRRISSLRITHSPTWGRFQWVFAKSIRACGMTTHITAITLEPQWDDPLDHVGIANLLANMANLETVTIMYTYLDFMRVSSYARPPFSVFYPSPVTADIYS